MEYKKKEVKKFFLKPKNLIISIIILIALLAMVASIYFISIYIRSCDTGACFSENLITCKKASWIREDTEKTLLYKIKSRSDNHCLVSVELLQLKQGAIEIASLEGKKMECKVPLGVAVKPEENLKNCQGLLKEEIQEIVIQRMHSQLVENLEQIGEQFNKVI